MERRGFTMIEAVVVTLLMAIVFMFASQAVHGSKQSYSRHKRLDVTRLARRLLDRLEDEVRQASVVAAPGLGKASLTLIHCDDRHRRIQYYNRNERGRNVFSLDAARAATCLSLVRVEQSGDQVSETIIARDPLLDFVAFRRLGKRLVAVEIQIDPVEAQTTQAASTCFSTTVALSRHFD